MRQVFRDLCTYSADLFGINSALYELGGLIVMHDASGCNSTYNTHDEPRWYDMDSMVYVSGLNEKDAILGNDNKLIDDVCDVALKEKPNFIALSRSVLPTYMGTDMTGIAKVIEKRTNIPTFGFLTNGMDSYVLGAQEAFYVFAKRFLKKADKNTDDNKIHINILGATPLDFSIDDNLNNIKQMLEDADFIIDSVWAMGSTFEEIVSSSSADVNLLISSTGIKAARYMYDEFKIPYVCGIPCGKIAGMKIAELITMAYDTGNNYSLFDTKINGAHSDERKIIIVGEAYHAASLRYQLEAQNGCGNVSVLCPLEDDAGALRDTDREATYEEDIRKILNTADVVIADPIYRRVIKKDLLFVDDPHDAYSGRMYHNRRFIFAGNKANLILERK